jgi:hypothetical protein
MQSTSALNGGQDNLCNVTVNSLGESTKAVIAGKADVDADLRPIRMAGVSFTSNPPSLGHNLDLDLQGSDGFFLQLGRRSCIDCIGETHGAGCGPVGVGDVQGIEFPARN